MLSLKSALLVSALSFAIAPAWADSDVDSKPVEIRAVEKQDFQLVSNLFNTRGRSIPIDECDVSFQKCETRSVQDCWDVTEEVCKNGPFDCTKITRRICGPTQKEVCTNESRRGRGVGECGYDYEVVRAGKIYDSKASVQVDVKRFTLGTPVAATLSFGGQAASLAFGVLAPSATVIVSRRSKELETGDAANKAFDVTFDVWAIMSSELSIEMKVAAVSKKGFEVAVVRPEFLAGLSEKAFKVKLKLTDKKGRVKLDKALVAGEYEWVEAKAIRVEYDRISSEKLKAKDLTAELLVELDPALVKEQLGDGDLMVVPAERASIKSELRFALRY